MQVSKWGNSLAVRLPKKLVEKMQLAEGDIVDIAPAGARSISIAKREDKAQFLESLRALQKPTPKGFRWNRDEANKR